MSNINPKDVLAVLLANEWHDVWPDSFELAPFQFDGDDLSEPGVSWRENDSIVSCPAREIQGVKTKVLE